LAVCNWQLAIGSWQSAISKENKASYKMRSIFNPAFSSNKTPSRLAGEKPVGKMQLAKGSWQRAKGSWQRAKSKGQKAKKVLPSLAFYLQPHHINLTISAFLLVLSRTFSTTTTTKTKNKPKKCLTTPLYSSFSKKLSTFY
jgi:hypothetical protein